MDLYEAIARGLKYNLDKRLKQLERGIVEARLEHVQMGMLPQAAAQAGWRGRDNPRASSSQSVLTGLTSLEVSTSEDKGVRYADLQMIWNVLDFGVTYLRSKQEANQVLIAEERRIKVVQNLAMDIRDTYWRAVAAEHLMPEVERLLQDIERGLATSRGLVAKGVGEPQDELKMQRALLTHKRDIVEVRRKLLVARSELAGLINLAPGTRFSVAASKHARLKVPHLRAALRSLETAALQNRPEMREEDYKGRNAALEVDMAWVRLLPGIELRGGPNFDSNSFLYNNLWMSAGVAVTKNLMDIIAAPRAIRFAETGMETADARRLALGMAVVTQVNISLQRFGLAKEMLDVANSLFRVDERISDIASDGSQKRGTSEMEALEARSKRVVSGLQFYVAYADVQASYGRVLNSVGSHRIPEKLDAMDVKSLAAHLRSTLDTWQPVWGTIEIASAR